MLVIESSSSWKHSHRFRWKTFAPPNQIYISWIYSAFSDCSIGVQLSFRARYTLTFKECLDFTFSWVDHYHLLAKSLNTQKLRARIRNIQWHKASEILKQMFLTHRKKISFFDRSLDSNVNSWSNHSNTIYKFWYYIWDTWKLSSMFTNLLHSNCTLDNEIRWLKIDEKINLLQI